MGQLAAHANSYPEWIDGYLELAEQARATGREFAAAVYDRAAEFFMTVGDPRRPAARSRFLHTIRSTYGVAPEYIPFGSGALPAYDLRPPRQVGPTIVIFGGFDSYIEEFLPMLPRWSRAGAASSRSRGPARAARSRTTGCR